MPGMFQCFLSSGVQLSHGAPIDASWFPYLRSKIICCADASKLHENVIRDSVLSHTSIATIAVPRRSFRRMLFRHRSWYSHLSECSCAESGSSAQQRGFARWPPVLVIADCGGQARLDAVRPADGDYKVVQRGRSLCFLDYSGQRGH